MDAHEDFACDCLQVTEAEVRAAVRQWRLADLTGLMGRSEAGAGCTCCHPELKRLIAAERQRADYFSPEPICSAR